MNKPIQIQITKDQLFKSPDEYCECGCPYFKERIVIKRLPGIMFGTTQDSFQPVPFMACEKCGAPHRATEFDVPRLKKPENPNPNEPKAE